MTMLDLTPFPYPNDSPVYGTRGSNLNQLDATTEYTAIVCQAREDMSVDRIGFSMRTATGSPTMTMTLETVSATDGTPTGTLLWTGATVTTGALTENTWTEAVLSSSGSISAGDIFAIKMVLVTGTAIRWNEMTQSASMRSNFPYEVSDLGAGAIYERVNNYTTLVLGSAANTYYAMDYFIAAQTANNSNITNADNAGFGLAWTPQFRCRICGIVWNTENTHSSNFNIVVRNTSGTELGSTSTNWTYGTISTQNDRKAMLLFDNSYVLEKDTEYYIMTEPQTSDNLTCKWIEFASATHKSGTLWGTNWSVVDYTDTSGYVKDTLKIPGIHPVLDQLDDGTGEPVTVGRGAIIGG